MLKGLVLYDQRAAWKVVATGIKKEESILLKKTYFKIIMQEEYILFQKTHLEIS